nr:hypothetical protein [Desulforhopalus vacuolatus]
MAFHKRKSFPQFQDEQLKLSEQSVFQLIFQIAFFQPQKIEEIGIFKVAAEMINLSQSQPGVGYFRTLKSLAFYLIPQLPFAPA